MKLNNAVSLTEHKLNSRQSLVAALNYFLAYQFLFPLVVMIVFSTVDPTSQQLLLGVYLPVFVIGIGSSRRYLSKQWYLFCSRFGHNLWVSLKHNLYIYGTLIIVNTAITFFFGLNESGNQTTVAQAFFADPLIYLLMIVIFAPVIEELLFRGVFYQRFRQDNRFLFALIFSSLAFGAIHVLPIMWISSSLIELVYIIPYGLMGLFMALAFEETGSIFGAISVHFINNLIGVLALMLI